MMKSLITVAIVSAMGLTAAQAQTPPAKDTRNPSIAMQTTAPGGADAGKLIGRNVKNMQNETIGEIKSIHLDQGGKVDGVLVGVGGFLGMGDREVLLAWRDLQVDANGEQVRVNMTKDQLKAKPEYSYKDPSWRGKVFTDSGLWTADRNATARTDTAARTDTTAAATRSTGDFNAAGQMSTDAIIGATVKNTANESIGTVDDVYVDNGGAVKLIVVSVGGFLGVGAKNVGVPWSDLKFGRDDNSIIVTTSWTKDSLKAMPDYKNERRAPAGATRSGG